MNRKCALQIVIFLCTFHGITNNSTCDIWKYNKVNECECIDLATKFEIGCPPDEQNIRITVELQKNSTIVIQCTLNGQSWNTTQFPELQNINALNKMKFNYCPKPRNSFSELLERFNVSNPKILIFHGTQENVAENFKKDMFANLYDLEQLTLSKNNIQTIDSDLFQHLTNLKALNLNENSIRTFHSDTFKYVTQLEDLELNNNKIETLKSDTFHPLKELKQLLLFDNNLTELPEDLLTENKKLEVLDLSFNPIEKIDVNLLSNNINLKLVCFRNTKLKELPEDLFRTNTALQDVRLVSNDNLSLPEHLITNMTNLKTVFIMNCNIAIIPKDFFRGCVNMENIDFAHNNLSVFHHGTFSRLEKLKELDLSNNFVKELPNDLFEDLINLEKLIFNNNRIEKLSENVLLHLNKLRIVDFSNNRLFTIYMQTFSSLSELRIVNLSHNLLAFDEFNVHEIFNGCHSLEDLDMSYNNLTAIAEEFYNYSILKKVDFRFNKITNVDLSYLKFSSKFVEMFLENNNISKINLENYDFYNLPEEEIQTHNLYLSDNPIRCDCELYDFVNFVQDAKVKSLKIIDDLQCESPNRFKNVFVNQLISSQLTCPMEECPESCDCFWRTHDKTYIVDCSYKNLSQVPVLTLKYQKILKTEVNLTGNQLTVSPSKLEGYNNVTKLYLSGNSIKRLNWIPPNIEALKLDDNLLERMNYETLQQLNNSMINFLSLENNPWICDCLTTNFTEYLRSYSAKQQISINNITCRSSGMKLINLNSKDLCKNITHIFMVWVIVLLCVLVTLVALIAIYYRYRLEIKIWLFAHNMFLWFVTEDEIDKDKLYDAFVSFAHQDEDYVVNELLPLLENGSDPYKLCIHHRDWIGGELIMTQIIKSIEESRRTIVVLSEHFLKSIWGKVEFRTAHQKALTEQCARVIIIIYGDVNPDEIIDEELKGYLKTHTYIKSDDKWFWYKLKYALPHSNKTAKTKSDHLRKVFTKIDKLDLIPVTNSANIGNTSPIEVTLDPLLLKNYQNKYDNELNTINNNKGNTTPVEENNRKI